MTEKKVETPEDGEVIGNWQDEKRAHIAKQHEEKVANSEDFTDVQDEDHDKTAEIPEETVPVESKADDLPQKRKFKVNGKEVEYTDDEIAALVQKGQSADEKYQEAARLRKEAEDLRAQAPVKPAPVENVETDYVALARALQMGSEEEAVAALRQIARSPVKTDDVARLVDERVSGRLSFEAQKQKFLDEYKDVMGDPEWSVVVLDLDELEHAKGTPPGIDRFKKIGDRVRALKAKSQPQASMQQKLERKASLTVVQSASARQVAPADEDKEESTHDTIASMAKARGQGVRVGNV